MKDATDCEMPSQAGEASLEGGVCNAANGSAAEPNPLLKPKRDKATKRKRSAMVSKKDSLAMASRMVLVDDLICDKDDRSEIDEDDLNRLVANIKMLGVLEPLIVRLSGGKYVVLAGKRRYRAAIAAGLRKVPCRVVIGAIAGRDALIALSENSCREPMSPYDQARVMSEILEVTGWSQRQLATEYGLSKGTVSEYLRLFNPEIQSKLSEDDKEKLKSGELSAKRVLRNLSRKPAERDQETSRRKAAATRGAGAQSTSTTVAGRTLHAALSWLDSDTGLGLHVSSENGDPPPEENLYRAVNRWAKFLDLCLRNANGMKRR